MDSNHVLWLMRPASYLWTIPPLLLELRIHQPHIHPSNHIVRHSLPSWSMCIAKEGDVEVNIKGLDHDVQLVRAMGVEEHDPLLNVLGLDMRRVDDHVEPTHEQRHDDVALREGDEVFKLWIKGAVKEHPANLVPVHALPGGVLTNELLGPRTLTASGDAPG